MKYWYPLFNTLSSPSMFKTNNRPAIFSGIFVIVCVSSFEITKYFPTVSKELKSVPSGILPLFGNKLLLVSLSSLLNTPRKMHKSKLSQNFYTIGRNNEAKSLSSNLEMVLPEQYYYQGSSTDGVIFSKKKHNLIICKHDGGSSYLMGFVTNGSFISILGNGNAFSVTVKNREITVISTAPYWYVLLI